MIYTPLTKKALRICFDAHKEQTDKSGLPYVFHPFHLADQMKDEYSTCAALLHDVIEDTDVTLDDLRGEFPPEVTEALELLTHDDGTPYEEYILRLRDNPIARAVKRADLRHNSDITRLDTVTERDLARVKKYKRALSLLNRYKRKDK